MTNHTGQVFGKLTVISEAPKSPRGLPRWNCRCECGGEAIVVGSDLRSGHTTSCGCRRKQTLSRLTRTHGRTGSPEYHSWTNMLARCRNPNHPRYADYGGRGIAVCDRWRESFENFLADMGPKPTPRHTIERADNDGPYDPANCRWASYAEQAVNTRWNRLVTHDGLTLTLGEWAARAGIERRTLSARLRLGWTAAEALTTPVARSNKLKAIRKS